MTGLLKNVLLFCGILSFGSAHSFFAHAGQNSSKGYEIIDVHIPKCKSEEDVDLRKVDIGFVCRTSKNGLFEKVQGPEGFGETWLDWDTGIEWGDKIGNYMQKKAVFECKKFECPSGNQAFLPSKKQFMKAESHGFREVLPSMENWFWSTSIRPKRPHFAFVFDADNGGADRGYRGFPLSVRCSCVSVAQ